MFNIVPMLNFPARQIFLIYSIKAKCINQCFLLPKYFKTLMFLLKFVKQQIKGGSLSFTIPSNFIDSPYCIIYHFLTKNTVKIR